MTRRLASSLVEVVTAAAILAVVGGMLVLAIAQTTLAGQRMLLGAQARRLLQQQLELIRTGRSIPASGTSGPFTLTVTTTPAPQPSVVGGGPPVWTPDCYGASPCSAAVTLSGVSSLTYAQVVITSTADGSELARGTTSTPP